MFYLFMFVTFVWFLRMYVVYRMSLGDKSMDYLLYYYVI
jgi:hypothetical protein